MNSVLFCAVAYFGFAAGRPACAVETRPAADAPPTFESHVRPILKAYCFTCHGEQGKIEAGLDLRLRRLAVVGGDSGPAVVPSKPGESLLLERVRSGEMPPGKDVKRLTPEQISVIERWISAGAATARPEPEQIDAGFLITDDDRRHWSFQPVHRPDVPQPKAAEQVRTPVDAFLLVELEKHGAKYAPEADRRTLVRRAFFDLIGLPPSIAELDEALSDVSPEWYEKLIDRLLASPHYGERWGRHWLDVAGYADSEGDTSDNVRAHVYRYRDYVIRSLNADKPFDEFICEQLAGDEMVGPISGTPMPEQAEKLIATGFLQMAPDATIGAQDARAAHDQLMADTIKIVSSSLLGLTVGCARCHDHRFDPISQDDYYRFRAIFEPALDPRSWQVRNRQVAYQTDEDRERAETLNRLETQALIDGVIKQQLAKVPKERREAAWAAVETPEDERSDEQKELLKKEKLDVTPENLQQIDRVAAQELQRLKPRHTLRLQGFIQTVKKAPGPPPKTYLFHRGDHREPRHELLPGELTILCGDEASDISSKSAAPGASNRRLAYAEHLTDGKHPLVARVLVNRVWMQHFGRGLCGSPTDLGLQAEPPSHPELLDWLATEFMEDGWSLKALHRQIMLSAAYRQASQRDATLAEHDPENRLLGGFPVRRLEAEIVRDAVLAVSGNLNRMAFGPSVPVARDPAGEIVIGQEAINAGIPLPVQSLFGEEWRRSVYVQARRTMPLTFMQMFDAPAMEPNCEARHATTVAPQSLVLMNSPFMLGQSLEFAKRVRREAGDDLNAQLVQAWKSALAREPDADELADAADFLREQTAHFRAHPPAPPEKKTLPGRNMMMMGLQRTDVLVETIAETDAELLALALLCQMLLSANEFLYVG